MTKAETMPVFKRPMKEDDYQLGLVQALARYEGTTCPICGYRWTMDELIDRQDTLVAANADQVAHQRCWVNAGRKVNS